MKRTDAPYVLRIVCALCLLFLCSSISSFAQSVQYIVWADNVYDDKIVVEAFPAKQAADTAFFVMPMSIPGTYSVLDYGRFITSFSAFDDQDNELSSHRQDSNRNVFVIPDGSACARVEYVLDDSFDDTTSPTIFHPAGTSFETDSLILLNFGGITGYFEHDRLAPIEVTIHHPTYLNASSASELKAVQDSEDVLSIEDYDKLIATPVMYTVAEPVEFYVDDARIVVALHSPNDVVKLETVAERVKPIVNSVSEFFGEFPVPSYAFLVYAASVTGSEHVQNIVGFGALEHPQSSVYFMPEMESEDQVNNFLDHAATHEIFHVFLPLYLHSEEIAHFNFKDPEMSAHLWLYEGVTEYFSQLARFRSGMMSEVEYIEAMTQKIRRFREAEFFRENPDYLTFSREVLEDPYKTVYGSVYTYGALQAMDLDLFLLRETNGEQDLFGLLQAVSKDYGPDTPFEDEELFDILQQYTDADLSKRLEENLVTKHVLNYEELFGQLGWEYVEADSVESLSFGIKQNTFQYNNETGSFTVNHTHDDNVIKFEKGDVVLSLDGVELSPSTAGAMWHTLNAPQETGTIQLIVERNGQNVTLEAQPVMRKALKRHFARRVPDSDTGNISSLREQYLTRN